MTLDIIAELDYQALIDEALASDERDRMTDPEARRYRPK